MIAFVAYLITNTVTGARYIGITSHSLRRRWNGHCARSNDSPIGRAIRKYGKTAFSMEPIASARSFADLKELEKALIGQHGTMVADGGYNVTAGGDGALGRVVSKETREKMRAASKATMADPARRAHLSALATKQWSTEESRATLSRVNKGRVHTPETRAKVAAAATGRPRSPETCAKLSAALTGNVRSPEVRAKISASKMGQFPTLEARQRMSAAGRGKPKGEPFKAALRARHARNREQRISP